MNKYSVFFLVLVSLFACGESQCADGQLGESAASVLIGAARRCSDTLYDYEASPSALNAQSVFYAAASLAIVLELYATWRNAQGAQGDEYLVSQHGEKYYVYTSGAHELLGRAFRGEALLQVHKELRASCICIEGMPGNGGYEFARNVAESYQAQCIEIDVRSLVGKDLNHVGQFFEKLAQDVVVNDKQTVLIFRDYDLVADCLYAQKSRYYEEAVFNTINESIAHVLKQPKAVCFFLVRNTGRLDWYFTDVIKPHMVSFGCPNMKTRARLMSLYCMQCCNKELKNAASYDCMRRIFYHTRGFTVQNIASMCARVAERQGSVEITDDMWNKAYYEELATCQKEHSALDVEYKVDMWDRLQILRHQLNDFAYRWCYACGLYNPKLTS